MKGRDFAVWELNLSKFPLGLTQGYSLEEVERWQYLYEEIGSFQGVSEYIKEIEGKTPADITIKRRLKQKFIKEKRNFKVWIKKYEDWHFKLYTEKDVRIWIRLYEKIGSFYGVERFLEDKYGDAPDNYTIYTRIKQKFDSENRNFEKWRTVFGQNFFEEVCRIYFEVIFRAHFPKKSPEWLRNPSTGRKMHLDGYNKNLRIAYEYNGPQHYEFTRPYHKSDRDMEDQQRRDGIKAKLCYENEILLIIIPYTVKIREMQNYIIKQYEILTGNTLPKMPKYDYKQFFYNDNLDRFL